MIPYEFLLHLFGNLRRLRPLMSIRHRWLYTWISAIADMPWIFCERHMATCATIPLFQIFPPVPYLGNSYIHRHLYLSWNRLEFPVCCSIIDLYPRSTAWISDISNHLEFYVPGISLQKNSSSIVNPFYRQCFFLILEPHITSAWFYKFSSVETKLRCWISIRSTLR